jgi:transposase
MVLINSIDYKGDHSMKEKDFVAFLGIDWSDKKHDIWLEDADSGKSSHKVLKHSPESIEEWAQELRTKYASKPIAVCLEQSRGALIAALMKYEFLVLYPINPTTLARYREAFSPSRAKDDPSDAKYLCELVRCHRDRLKPLKEEDETTRKIRYLVEHRRTLVNERSRISNRLESLLKGYFPQVLEWFSNIRTELVCSFLSTWSTPDELRNADEATLLKFFRDHGSRSSEKNKSRIDSIMNMVALTNDKAVIESSSLIVKGFIDQMRSIIISIKRVEKEIDSLFKNHSDSKIFDSFPGSGDALSARLMVAFGTDRERFKDANAASRYFGIAPVIERSGNSEWIRWRYFCPKFIRQSFHEFAGQSIKFSFWAKNFYQSQREKGKSHHKAVRALAFKWVRVLFACWKNNTVYDESKYLMVLQKRGSSILASKST